jgi:hypothetical protein
MNTRLSLRDRATAIRDGSLTRAEANAVDTIDEALTLIAAKRTARRKVTAKEHPVDARRRAEREEHRRELAAVERKALARADERIRERGLMGYLNDQRVTATPEPEEDEQPFRSSAERAEAILRHPEAATFAIIESARDAFRRVDGRGK